jgi:CubicO group peptidase (beta-lactamase class C family)
MRPLLAALSLALIALTATAQSLERDVDQLAAETLRVWQIPGLAVAVVQNDKVILAKGYGVKELGKSDRVGPDTLFAIASTTKAFTTTAMAMLADEKKLDWDDPVRKYVPYFHLDDPCADSLVTLRDIVSHRTGLSRHDELWDNAPFTREDIIGRMSGVKLSKPFRSAYQYNNIMFMTAGEVLASAAKTSWDDFVKTRIFDPLGMTHTQTRFADWASSDHATGHLWSKNAAAVRTADDDSSLGPAGSIKSSARDMAQWLRFQLAGGVIDGKRLVSAEALEVTRTPLTPIAVDKSSHELNPFTNVLSYAMGWNISDYRGELLVAHGGALNSTRTQVALLPYRNAAVFVTGNMARGYGVLALRNDILDLLLQAKPWRHWNAAYLDFEKKGDERAEKRKMEREAKRKPEAKPTHDLAAYAGTYHDAAYGDAVVALENGGLVVRWNRLTLPLVHFTYDSFTAASEEADVDETVQFRLAPDGSIQSMSIFGEEFSRQ